MKAMKAASSAAPLLQFFRRGLRHFLENVSQKDDVAIRGEEGLP